MTADPSRLVAQLEVNRSISCTVLKLEVYHNIPLARGIIRTSFNSKAPPFHQYIRLQGSKNIKNGD